jgi:hypothetical protein
MLNPPRQVHLLKCDICTVTPLFQHLSYLRAPVCHLPQQDVATGHNLKCINKIHYFLEHSLVFLQQYCKMLGPTVKIIRSCPTHSLATATVLLYILLYSWNNAVIILLCNFSMSFWLLLLTALVCASAVTVLFSFSVLPLWHFLLIHFYSF